MLPGQAQVGPAHILNSSLVPHKSDAASEFTAVKAIHVYTVLTKPLGTAERLCNSGSLFTDKSCPYLKEEAFSGIKKFYTSPKEGKRSSTDKVS